MENRSFHIISVVLMFIFFIFNLGNPISTYAAAPTPIPTPTKTPAPNPNPPFPDVLKDNKLPIAWVGVPMQNVWIYTTAKKGAMKKASELSKEGPYKVEILDYSPNSWDWAVQNKMFEKAISKKGVVEAIITDCFDQSACETLINEAVDSDLPVITYDKDTPNSKRLTNYTIDNTEVGKMAADLLNEAIPDGGDVAIYSDSQEGPVQERYEGFKNAIEGSNLSIVTEVIDSDWNKSCALIDSAMTDYPDIKGWFFTSPAPILQNCTGLTNWKKATQAGMVTVSADTFPQELDWIRAKKLYAAIDQPYWGWGYDTVQMMYDYMLYGKEFDKVTCVKPNIITFKNVNAYQDMVKKNDYSKPLPSYK